MNVILRVLVLCGGLATTVSPVGPSGPFNGYQLDVTVTICPVGPMDKAPAYGAGDSGFESLAGLLLLIFAGCTAVHAAVSFQGFQSGNCKWVLRNLP